MRVDDKTDVSLEYILSLFSVVISVVIDLLLKACTKTRNNETKRPKRNKRNDRNSKEVNEKVKKGVDLCHVTMAA